MLFLACGAYKYAHSNTITITLQWSYREACLLRRVRESQFIFTTTLHFRVVDTNANLHNQIFHVSILASFHFHCVSIIKSQSPIGDDRPIIMQREVQSAK